MIYFFDVLDKYKDGSLAISCLSYVNHKRIGYIGLDIIKENKEEDIEDIKDFLPKKEEIIISGYFSSDKKSVYKLLNKAKEISLKLNKKYIVLDLNNNSKNLISDLVKIGFKNVYKSVYIWSLAKN